MNDKQVMNQEQNNKLLNPLFHLTPDVDIYETAVDLVVIADLPGVAESALQLEVSRGVLTLEGEIQSTDSKQPVGYYRQFKLSDRIDADAGSAELKDGVLTLRLPKVEAVKPKKIVVKTLH